MDTGPNVGQKVTFVSLLTDKEFPGTIVKASNLNNLCKVKIKGQKEWKGSVLYFEKRPTVVNGLRWKICFPVEE